MGPTSHIASRAKSPLARRSSQVPGLLALFHQNRNRSHTVSNSGSLDYYRQWKVDGQQHCGVGGSSSSNNSSSVCDPPLCRVIQMCQQWPAIWGHVNMKQNPGTLVNNSSKPSLRTHINTLLALQGLLGIWRVNCPSSGRLHICGIRFLGPATTINLILSTSSPEALKARPHDFRRSRERGAVEPP